MALSTEYKRILNESFSTHFPGWEQLPPLDPLKMIAESVAGSAAEIERRQNRALQTILSSMPSLFAFHPKAARPPVALFQFQLPAKSHESLTLGGETSFRMRADNSACVLTPLSPVAIQPVSTIRTQVNGHRVSVSFTHRGHCPELPFHFVPAGGGEGNEITSASLAIQTSSGARTERFLESLEILQATENFTAPGTVCVKNKRPRGGALSMAPAQFELILEFTRPFRGTLSLNSFPCRLMRALESVSLGHVKGDAWESLPLAEEVISPPDTLELHFPDGQIRALQRIEESILTEVGKATGAPESEIDTYFYNGIEHSLVIPFADVLLGGYHGEIPVVAPSLELAPEASLPLCSLKADLGAQAAILESISCVAPIHAFRPRENREAYLSRFYSAMRSLHAGRGRALGVYPSELRQAVLASDAQITEAEVASGERGIWNLYVLADDRAASPPAPLSAPLKAKIDEAVGRRLPLKEKWAVLPFRERRLSFAISMELRLKESRAAVLSPDRIQLLVSGGLANVLASLPAGLSEEVSTAELVTQLSRRLTGGESFQPDEIASLGLVARDPSSGLFCSGVRREPGQLLRPELSLTVTYASTREASHG